MAEVNKMLSTDVLVIGGGMAALPAAIKVLDQGANVIVADKSTAGWSGQVPLGGGHIVCIPPDKVEASVKYLVKEGEYLNDQEFTEAYVKDTYPFILEMDKWLGPIYYFRKDLEGNLWLRGGGVAAVIQRETGLLPMLLRRILEKGGKVLNKVFMVDLIKHDGRVVGAVGFHYQTGDFYVIQAKSVILACGGCMYKSRPQFHVNCGEGVAMAYKAGAEMRNAEYANMFTVSDKPTAGHNAGGPRDERLIDGPSTGATADRRILLENALGEKFLYKYPGLGPNPGDPPWFGRRASRQVYAVYKEIEAGRGPIYQNLIGHPEAAPLADHTKGMLQENYRNKMARMGIDVNKEKVEWAIAPEFHGGPIRINRHSETSLPGLYAAGDIIWQGSANYGAVAFLPGGNPMSLAMVTGFWAGIAAGQAAGNLPESKVSKAEVNQLRKDVLSPLGKKEGYNPYDAVKDVQEVVFKLKNSFIKREDRLKNALDAIGEIESKLENLTAKDSHELVRCHEAKAMATNAELLYQASLSRKESRGCHIREDYPDKDDKNWLKWIILKKGDAKTKSWTEPVPIERYKFKSS